MTPSAVAPKDPLNCHARAGRRRRSFTLQIDTPETAVPPFPKPAKAGSDAA